MNELFSFEISINSFSVFDVQFRIPNISCGCPNHPLTSASTKYTFGGNFVLEPPYSELVFKTLSFHIHPRLLFWTTRVSSLSWASPTPPHPTPPRPSQSTRLSSPCYTVSHLAISYIIVYALNATLSLIVHLYTLILLS